MDRSIRSLTDPIARAPIGERRRGIRQKLHTPVYASFNGPQTGMVVDLSELLDLHEEGFAVQTSQRLEVNQPVTVCLDLPETKSYIHCTGHVIWSDDAGRGGVRFSALTEKSRKILKEWLFANLMIGSSNHAARADQLARRDEGKMQEETGHTKSPSSVPISDGSATLSAVEAVRLVIREMGNDLDAILRLISERASSFTGASGSALALITDGTMICRARAGEQGPPLGAVVDVAHGLSGECVRSGLLVSCVDTERDPRVDPEVCRALGVGSLMAAPIVAGLQVIGLLEIFSPQPNRFTSVHRTVLTRLIELIPQDYLEDERARFDGSEVSTASSGASQAAFSEAQSDPSDSNFSGTIGLASGLASHVSGEPLSEAAEPFLEEPPATGSRLLYRALIGLAIIAVFVVIGYLVAPVVDKRWAVSPQASQRSGQPGNGTASVEANRQTKYLSDLRDLAERGNADAQWQLGARYHNGDGVPVDDILAMQWFERAAEQGHVTAQATLGAYYWAGRGVAQDLTKAYFWSALAVAQGDENSKARLEGLASQMTREEVAAARQQAEVWLSSHNAGAKSAPN